MPNLDGQQDPYGVSPVRVPNPGNYPPQPQTAPKQIQNRRITPIVDDSNPYQNAIDMNLHDSFEHLGPQGAGGFVQNAQAMYQEDSDMYG